MFFDPAYMLFIMLPTAAFTMYAQFKVKSAYRKWDDVQNSARMTGLDTAQALMRHAGLEHVQVQRTPGHLTDFYNPKDKSINLSESSTARPSVASMAIVAHELGHAEQDKVGNSMLRLRASLVPAANIGSNLGIWVIIGGLMLSGSAPSLGTNIAWAGVWMFGAAVAFTIVTLPVEFDASRRAKRWLGEAGLVSRDEARGVDAVLDAAALTYVAAAAAAILNLLYWVWRISGRRD